MSEIKTKSKLEETIGDVRAGQSQYSEDDWQQKITAFLGAVGVKGQIVKLSRPAGGASAASVVFLFQHDGEAETKPYVARLKPESSFWTVFDTVEQFTVQQYFNQCGLPVPAALWLDEEGAYLGRPGYIMDFAEGSSATAAYFSDGPLSGISKEKRFTMMRNMIDSLAQFHNKTEYSGVRSLMSKGRGESWIEREINMWFDLIGHARPEMVQYYEPVRRWFVDTAPEVTDPVIIHGDYQGSNVLWMGEQVSAILDFEAVRIGPRESDIAHQYIMDEIGARLYGELDIEIPSLPLRAAWYEEAAGVELKNLDYHFARAAFQLACGGVGLTKNLDQDLVREPTAFMDYINRRLLTLISDSLPFEPALPVRAMQN